MLDLYFDLLHFTRLVESFGSHSVFEVRVDHGRVPSLLCIRNVVPAPFLAPRIQAAGACILFSATLSPQQYYADTLGLPHDTVWLDVEPAFASDQLAVKVVGHISTRFRSRERSLRPIARLIGVQFERLPQVNPVNEMMKDTMQAAFGAGYDYAYLFPGIRKVVQAAGRVLRGPTDTSVLYLIDDRYGRRAIQQLLPRWWRCEQCTVPFAALAASSSSWTRPRSSELGSS